MHFLTLAADGDHVLAQVLDFASNPLVWVTALTVFIIPMLNGAVTRPGNATPDWVKNLITLVLAGLYAVVAHFSELGDLKIDWPATILIFVVAAAGAGGVHASLVKGAVANKLANKVPINIGPTMTPEKAAAMHSNKSGALTAYSGPPAGDPANVASTSSGWSTPPEPFSG